MSTASCQICSFNDSSRFHYFQYESQKTLMTSIKRRNKDKNREEHSVSMRKSNMSIPVGGAL